MPGFAAFPNGYTYCKLITTSVTMVSGNSDLANYPLTVVLTDPDLKTTGNGGFVNNSNGYDIGFYPDCSGAGSALKWEVEKYDGAAGSITAHVLRPTLSHTTNDGIGMYYGGSFNVFQSTPSAVWNSDYKGVWHFSSLTTDSTGLNTTTNNGASLAAGQVGTSIAVTSPASVDVANSANINTASVTAECWFKRGATQIDYARVFSKGSDNSGAPWGRYWVGTGVGDPSSFGAYLGFSDNSNGWWASGTGAFAVNTWYHIALTYDGTILAVYVNGVQQYSASYGKTLVADSKKLAIGSNGNGGQGLNGGIDEFRISGVARSADWILTEYRNQNTPGAYLSLGARTTSGGQPAKIRHSVRDGI